MDKELLYNQSGIKDETAYRAIKSLSGGNVNMKGYEINKGEIWEVENGAGTRLVVVLNCYEKYAATVMLQDTEPTSNAVRVRTVSGLMYADAGRLGYVFYDKMVDFARALSEEEDQELRKAIAAALELEVTCEQIPEEDVAELTFRLETARAEADVLRRNIAEAKEIIGKQAEELEKEKAEKEYTELPPCVSIEEVITERMLREDLAAARREAEIYKGLYEDMLARALG